MEKTFGTAINCMDGRAQEPVLNYLKERFETAYIDTITEPGPVAVLGNGGKENLKQSIMDRLDISLVKHKSKFIAVAAHHDCAGNPVSESAQIDQLRKSVAYLKSLESVNVPVIGLWLDEDFSVREIR